MIERLNELNRVLDAVSTLQIIGTRSSIPTDLIIRVCQSGVRRGVFPDHHLTLRFSVELGLLASNYDHFELTDEGRLFVSLNPEQLYELTREQLTYLTRTKYLSGPWAGHVRQVLSQFSRSYKPPLLSWSELDDAALDAQPWVLNHLCQLGQLIPTAEGYESHPDSGDALVNCLEAPKGLTEDRLRELLLEREVIGDVGEELALAFEQTRLLGLGQVVEAACIRRISKTRVNAGYDLQSFDCKSVSGIHDRFIEVKASRGHRLQFYWSENEMHIAERLGRQYWIYFFSGVDLGSRSSIQPPIIFQDPMKSIFMNDQFSKDAQGVFVQMKTGAKG